MSAMQALMERELGRAALELLKKESTMTAAVQAAENRTLGIIQTIQTVLDDPARSVSTGGCPPTPAGGFPSRLHRRRQYWKI